MPPAILLMRRICIKIWTTQKHMRSPVLSLAYAKHTHPQSLSSELPGSSLQLLWCQQLPPKHTDTSFHIHNYTRKKLKEKKNKQHIWSFSHMQRMKGTQSAAKTLSSVLFFLFAIYLHYFLWDNSSDTAAALNNGDISCYSCFLWAVKGPEEDQIYIQPLIYIFTSTLH